MLEVKAELGLRTRAAYRSGDRGALAALLSDWRAAQGEARTRAGEALWTRFAQDAPFAPVCFKRGSLLLRWGMASNLNPTRANPYYKMDQWITAG